MNTEQQARPIVFWLVFVLICAAISLFVTQ